MTETYLRGAKATAKLAEFEGGPVDGRRVIIIEFATGEDHVSVEIGVDEVREMWSTIEVALEGMGW